MRKKIKLFFAKRMYELDVGRFFTSFFQFMLIAGTFIKVHFDLPIGLYIFVFIGVILVVWFVGYLMLTTGFYDKFQLQVPIYKRILAKKKDEDENRDKR